jgi:hypothetical protein
MGQNLRLMLLFCIAFGIVIFILSITYRRKSKLRSILINSGILFGLIPVLGYMALSLFLFIKERPYVGNYRGQTEVHGIASLDVFDDNTFIMRTDSCSTGFVQGKWSYRFINSGLKFESTSQRMGEFDIINSDSLVVKNIPICINLVKKITLVRSGKPMTLPLEEIEF